MSLLTLPTDLLFLVSAHLDYPSLLSLSLTSRNLHAAVNPDTFCPLSEKIAFYLRAERHFPQNAGKLVCFSCWKFKETAEFGVSKRTGRFGKFSLERQWGKKDGVRRGTRFCWECGVRGRRYVHLEGVRREKGGVLWYPCHRCGEAAVKGERCLKEGCVVGRGWRWGGRSGLERLPGRVLERVCGELGYGDLLALRRTCRAMRAAVGDPVGVCRDVYSMWAFVMQRELGLPAATRHWLPEARPCFGCFRMRKREQFSPKQYYLSSKLSNGEYWRRRCWECLRRFYGPPHQVDKVARARFESQCICPVCKSMRRKGEDCSWCWLNRDKVAEWARLREAKRVAKGSYNFWGGEDDAVVPRWFDEEAPLGGAPEDDDDGEEGIGPCLERLALGCEDLTERGSGDGPAASSSHSERQAREASSGNSGLRGLLTRVWGRPWEEGWLAAALELAGEQAGLLQGPQLAVVESR